MKKAIIILISIVFLMILLFAVTVARQMFFGAPSEIDNSRMCDLNCDKKCDELDVEKFNESIGKCTTDKGYNLNADIDFSGCIDRTDRYFLFEQDVDDDDVPDAFDNCPGDSNSDQLDDDNDGKGNVCDDYPNLETKTLN